MTASARQIVVDLVMDSDDFEKKSKRVGDSAETMGKKVSSSSAGAEKLGRSWDDVGESFDGGETRFMGTADLLDGLATTMGLNVGGAIEMSRGFADLSSGIANSLVPALTVGTAKVKAMSAAFLASPTAKLKLGLVAAAAATAYVAAETGNLNRVMAASKGVLSDSVKGWDMVLGKLFSVVGASAAAGQSLKELQEAGKTVTGPDPLAPKGGGVSVDDLKNYSGNGAADWSAKGAADRIRKASEEAQAAAMRSSLKAGEAGAKAAGAAADKAAKAVEDKLKARFAKIEDVLESALRSWQDKLRDAKSMRDGFRDLFSLDVKNDDPFGLVHGLKSQAATMKRWVTTIAQLRKMGFREGIVRDLVDRGPSSLADAVELSHVSKKDVNALYDSTQALGKSFGNAETERRTGIDVTNPKPVKVTLDVKGSDKDLVNLIKKWVRTEGGGNVQVAFGKK